MCVLFQSRLVSPALIRVTSAFNPVDYKHPLCFLPNLKKSGNAEKS